jgi:hypothetical protein
MSERERTPAAFRHTELDAILNMVTSDLRSREDAENSIERLLVNIGSVLVALKSEGEKSGYDANLLMDQLDNIIEVLKHKEHLIVSAVIENTELDV